MLRLAAGVILLIIAAPVDAGPPSAVAAPQAIARQSGPVESIFQEWLSAFNSNNQVTIKAFYAKYLGDPDPAFAIENAQDSCGLTAQRILERSPTS